LIQKLEISLPSHTGCAHVAFDDFGIDFSVRGNNNRAQAAWLGEYHVIAFLPAQLEPVLFKNTAKLLMRNRSEAPLIRPLGKIVGHVVRGGEER